MHSLVVGTEASSSSPASGPGNRMTTAVSLPCYASKNIIDNKFLLYVIIAFAQQERADDLFLSCCVHTGVFVDEIA